MASLKDLRKRPSGYTGTKPWQVRYRDHTGRQRNEQFTRKTDAQARHREVQTAEETGRLDMLDAGTTTLEEAWLAFYKLQEPEWSENTAYGLAKTFDAVVRGTKYDRAPIADMPVRNIRKSHVQTWKNDAIAAGVPVESIRRGLSLITRTLDHAEDEGMVDANPAARVKPPPAAKVRASIISPVQVEAIRAEMDARDAAFVSILAYGAMRPHEVRALRADQIGPSFHLEQACAEDGSLQPLKGGHEMRDVPVCAALAADLDAIDWGTGLMFTNANGDAWTKTDYDNWRKRKFNAAVTAANARLKAEDKIPDDLTPYDLRHSMASLWYREGVDKGSIAARCGHSIQVLETRYLWHFKTLDALDRRTVDEMIADARKAQ